jgi:Tol biopolymer transport system component
MEFLSWSPDGTKLLFRADQNIDDITYTNLYVMNLPSHEVVQLTVTGLVAGATWSPDSSQIVFSDRFQGTFIINPAGTNQTELSCNGEEIEASYQLAWSPDGAKIAYSPNYCSSSPSETSCGVYVLSLENNACEHVAALRAYGPVWRP